MAGRQKRRRQKQQQEAAPPSDWVRDLTTQLLAANPVATGAVPEEHTAGALTKFAALDREFLEQWWRDQLALIERRIRERAEALAGRTEHPSEVFGRQALQFGAMGMPQDVAAALLGLDAASMMLYYGREYATGAAEANGQVAANLLRIATSTDDKYAVKAAVEWMNRRGGEEWKPPAQKLELSRAPAKSNIIDSSKLTFEERQALKAIITRAVARAAAPGALLEESDDGEREAG